MSRFHVLSTLVSPLRCGLLLMSHVFRGPSPRGGVRVDLSDASHTLPTGGGGVWGLVRTDPHWRRHGLRYLFTPRAPLCSHPKAAPGSMADGHSERAEILPGAPASTHESDDSHQSRSHRALRMWQASPATRGAVVALDRSKTRPSPMRPRGTMAVKA